MKILYSHRTRSADGQYVHIRALTEALARRGHSIFMTGPDDYGMHGAPRRLDAVAGEGGLRRLLPKPAAELAEIAYSIPAHLRLARAARLFGPDVLYERYNLFYHAGVRLSRARRLPYLLEVNSPLVEERAKHGGLALQPVGVWSEGSLWRAADAVLPVTGVLGRMIEARGADPGRIHVIPNGVDDEFLTEVDPRPVRERYGVKERLVLGFTGFVRDWHRVDFALRFIAASGRKDLHLLLVGDGSARAGLEAEARALGVADQFTATGVVQREEVAAHVAAFDIGLQPAVTPYASPLKLFEYMALSRPVIAPASANIREILTDGEDALLFATGDEAAFAKALGALVGDAALRARLGAAAKATLLKRDLTWAGNAARVEGLAQNLLARNADAARDRDRTPSPSPDRARRL